MKPHGELVSFPIDRRNAEIASKAELKTILHVDDDPDIRVIIKMALEVVGEFDVVQFGSGAEALAVAGQLKPDLMLLDVMMPDMSGQQLRRQLVQYKALEDVPVIFLTAKAEDHFSRELLGQGAMSVITKPIDPMVLSRQIEKLWKSME